jgi:hypothetical protein
MTECDSASNRITKVKINVHIIRTFAMSLKRKKDTERDTCQVATISVYIYYDSNHDMYNKKTIKDN